MTFSLETSISTNQGDVSLTSNPEFSKIIQSLNDCSRSRQFAYTHGLNLSNEQLLALDMRCLFVKAIHDAASDGRFIEAHQRSPNAIHFEIRLKSKDSPSSMRKFWRYLSAFTLLIVPYWEAQDVYLEATAYRNGSEIPVKS
jgi:hypothetical protein